MSLELSDGATGGLVLTLFAWASEEGVSPADVVRKFHFPASPRVPMMSPPPSRPASAAAAASDQQWQQQDFLRWRVSLGARRRVARAARRRLQADLSVRASRGIAAAGPPESAPHCQQELKRFGFTIESSWFLAATNRHKLGLPLNASEHHLTRRSLLAVPQVANGQPPSAEGFRPAYLK